MPAEIEARVAEEATRRGIGSQALAMRLIEQGLPPLRPAERGNTATLAWLEERGRESEQDRTDDPVELARRKREFDESMRAIDRHAGEKSETD